MILQALFNKGLLNLLSFLRTSAVTMLICNTPQIFQDVLRGIMIIIALKSIWKMGPKSLELQSHGPSWLTVSNKHDKVLPLSQDPK